jgi:hypothetical protein
MTLNSLFLIKLGQVYRTELLAKNSVNEMLDENIFGRENRDCLLQFSSDHQKNLDGLTEIFETIRFSPLADTELPAKVQRLLELKNFPDRLFFSWLSEFEARLSDQYDQVSKLHERTPNVIPVDLWKKLEKVRHRQELLTAESTRVAHQTTGILNTSEWELKLNS